ncbi:MAG: hypothetical protein DRG30_03510 [Epsilonproteobacteria bacterium]|nr:MAG: hypothetical protein DRG30_03510 [Campylobacterota bacterium]
MESKMYTIIVTKLPQEAGNELAQVYVEYANTYKRTLSYSLDDTLRLMKNPMGNERSYVEIVNPQDLSQQQTIEELDKQGIDWVELDLTPDFEGQLLNLIPNYSQTNPQWADYPLGDGSIPSKTIGNWGCLGTVYTSMAQYMGLCTDNPQEFNDRMVHCGAMSGVYVQPAALRTCFPNEVSYQGWYTTDIVNWVKAQISKNVPVPARVDLDSSANYTQHWVLIIGYDINDNLIIADPYPYEATVKYQVDTIYDHIHEVLIYDYKDEEIEPTPPTGNTIDLAPYFTTIGNSQLFELQTKIDGASQGQERLQLQMSGDVSYITKNTLFEQLKVTDNHIQRGIDTSPNEHDYYVLTQDNGELLVNWMARYMRVGETFTSTPNVTSYNKTNCGVTQSTQATTDYLTLDAVYDTFDGFNGIVLGRTIAVSWRKTSNVNTPPIEVYYFTDGLGLTGWGEDSSGKQARVSEIHGVGQRPDNIKDWYCIPQEWRL